MTDVMAQPEIIVTKSPFRAKLDQLIDEGVKQAKGTFERLDTQIPKDYVVGHAALNFKAYTDSNVTVGFGTNGSSKGFNMHPHAMTQSFEKASIPKAYAETLLREGQSDLLAENLNQRYARQTSKASDPKKYLIREIDGEVRGFLSNKFRRMDSRPIVKTFLESTSPFGMVPLKAQALDTKYYLKMVVPTIFEVRPNEPILYGLCLQNSDFGDGALVLQVMLLRLICVNGCMSDTALRKVHLGARLGSGDDDSVEFSDETYDLDSRTMSSAVKDLVKSLVAPEVVKGKIDLVRAAFESTIDATAALAGLRSKSRITKAEEKQLSELYRSADVEMLPPGNSSWRLSNTLSLLAQQVDPGRGLELENLAGSLIGLRAA
jgi:hypothetical protein